MREARYIYCIVPRDRKISLGRIGVENNEVYTIPYKDLCAVAHSCPSQPYNSGDKKKVESWIIAHAKVIEKAWQRFDTVLPLSFDTIIKSEKGRDAEHNLKKWMKDNYKNLRQKLNKLRNKAEFGVQIFWNPRFVAQALIETDGKIKKLNEDIETKPKGLAYMYKQKLEDLIKKQMEKEAEKYFRDFYGRIKRWTDEIKVEKSKKSEEEKQMFMNLSCLLSSGNNHSLGKELEEINSRKEFFVRFTGPWPPYSFV